MKFNIPFLLKYIVVLVVTTVIVISAGINIVAASESPKPIILIKSPVFAPSPIPITYKEMAKSAAQTCFVPVGVYHYLIQTESAWNPYAVSKTSAFGLAQLMPKTAKYLNVNYKNPNDNLIGGACYLSSLLIKYNGDVRKALHAYNAGPGNVDRGNVGVGTRRYASKIISSAEADNDL